MITPPKSEGVNTCTASDKRGESSVSPLLIPARKAAAICGKSLRTWRTWDALGLIPKPVRIGRSTLWRADELRNWVAAGCPRREQWEAQR